MLLLSVVAVLALVASIVVRVAKLRFETALLPQRNSKTPPTILPCLRSKDQIAVAATAQSCHRDIQVVTCLFAILQGGLASKDQVLLLFLLPSSKVEAGAEGGGRD